MFDLSVLKTQLQARINALTNASTFDQVIDVAIATKKAVSAGVYVDRTIVDAQVQRITNALGAGSAIEDLIVIAASAEGDGDSIPIGAIQKFGFAGEKFTDNNNYEWLALGLLHSKTGYEKALNNPGTCAYGQQVYTAQASTAGSVTKAADDGLGNIVIASASLTHVIVSHDFGTTFVAVPHNLPNRAMTVEYVGGHFVLASNDATGIRTSYSADGGTTFSDAALARGLSAGIPDTVRSSCSGTNAMFVVNNDVNAVVKTSGTANTAVTLPAAINGSSYTPIIQFFSGAFYVAGKNTSSYYKTTNNGSSFSSHLKPIGSLVEEQVCVALGKFFWMGQSGSDRYYKYTSDFVTWNNLIDVLPEYLVKNSLFYSSGTKLTVYAVEGGLVINTHTGNYFTANLIDFKLIHYSRSAVELAGVDAMYVPFKNLVMAGKGIFDANTSPLSSAVLKVNYSTPDYVGVHRHGVANITNDQIDYVRIK